MNTNFNSNPMPENFSGDVDPASQGGGFPARARALLAATLVLTMTIQSVDAAQTQLSNTPLASATSTQVKPNIMYLMDTSGSMDSPDMPDSVGRDTSRIGYKQPVCNTMYYNRDITYVVPKKSDGSNFAIASFTAAYSNGYTNYPTGPTTGAINLSTSFKAHSADTSQPAYYYIYTGSQTLVPSTGACLNSDGNSTSTYNTNIAATGGGNFQKIKVTSTSGIAGRADETTNFAIWYQYYRTRLMMMKGTASRAFNQLTDSYRVGFITIVPGSPVSSTQYTPIADFDTTQRTAWFTKLFSQSAHDSTPLREALSRVGRHYAGKQDGINNGMTGDPVQYSCQQNFTLLTTDGYWNGSGGVDLDGNTLNSTSTDSDIAATPRPMWDGGASVNTTTNKSNTFRSTTCSTMLKELVQQQLRTFQYQTRTETTRQRTQQIQTKTVQTQSRTIQWQTQTVQRQLNTDQIQAKTDQIQQRTQQLQRQTNQLQRQTNQLQRQTNQLQRQTNQLQRNTEQQQRRTAQHQTRTQQIEQRTVQNQRRTIQWQTKTQQLQQRTQQLQATQTTQTKAISILVLSPTTSNSGQSSSFTSISIGGTNQLIGTVSSNNSTSRQARALAMANLISLNNGYTVINTQNCPGSGGPSGCDNNSAYLTIMAPAVPNSLGVSVGGISRLSTTTNSFNTGSVTTNVTSSVSSCTVGTVVSPANVTTVTTACPTSDSGFVNAASCLPTTPTGTFNASGTQITCQMTNPAFVNSASCTASSGGGVIIICNVLTDSGLVNVGTCTASDPVGGPTVTCSVASDTGFVTFSSCAPSNPASGPTITCNTTDSGFVNSAACTPNSGPVAGLTITCQLASDTGFANLNSSTACAPSNPASGPTVTCQSTFSGFVDLLATSCSTTSTFNSSGQKFTCQTVAGTFTNLAATSCTPSSPAASFNGSGQNFVCQTVAGTFTDLAATSCTPSSPANSFNSSGQNFVCQTVAGPFVDVLASSCAASSPANSFNSSGQNFVCQTQTGTFTNFAGSTCTPSSPAASFNSAGQNFVCQTADTGFLDAASCAATTPVNTFNSSGTQITCQTRAVTAFTNANSCSANTSGTGLITSCRTVTSGFANATTCTPSVVGGLTTTCRDLDTSGGFVNSAQCTASVVNGLTTNCLTTSDTGFVNVAVCTASNPGTGPTVTCNTLSDTGFVNTATCTASSPSSGPVVTCNTADTGFVLSNTCTATTPVNTFNGSGTQITCQTTDSGFVNSGTCTASTPTGIVVTCQTVSDSGLSNVGTCTASDPASGPTVTCPTSSGGWKEYTTGGGGCSAGTNNTTGITTNCQPNAPVWNKLKYQTTTSTTTLNLTTGVTTNSTPTNGNWTDLTGVCTAAAPTVPSARAWTAGDPPTPSGACTSYPCTITGSSGGSNGSLADVAEYYYRTDLRPTMTDNVPSGGTGVEDDKATWQHMTTFTLGLGLAGTLTYDSNYKTANTGDFQSIRDGSLNWPAPSADQPTALDDLWHAAVNGRGQFFSASNPDAVVDGLVTALAGVQARVASAAAAATSNLEPVAGDNFAYTAKYKTLEWTGELEAHEINLSTGVVSTTALWSAQTSLDTLVGAACDKRSIYLFRSGDAVNAPNKVVDFTWSTQGCDSSFLPTGAASTKLNATEMTYFGASAVAALSHYPSMTDGTGSPVTADQRTLARGANLVNFIRGQRGLENFTSNDPNKLYRQRTHVLGDIVNAQPVYVKAPFANYNDDGYLATHPSTGVTAFKTTGTASTRAPMVYVASNDGMLHAFYAGSSSTDALGGTERWALIPSMVLPNLYKLADDNYQNNHRYSVDGTPTVGDFYDTSASVWKSMLVAGLNAGGKGYYALDITNPAAPKGLWEFKWSDTCYDSSDSSTAYADCHLGYTFSNPIISKMTDGTWVVMVTSGHNNVNSPAKTGDGNGYLYVLRAYDGKILYKIATNNPDGTPVGTATTPSGLNHIVNWVDSTLVNNTTLRVYGGDLLGNMWRFDINNTINPAGREATLIGQAKSPGSGGLPQPITTRPELALKGSDPFIMFATGQLLGSDDLTNNQVQSIYGVVDPLTNTTTAYTALRGSLKPLGMTQTSLLLDQNNNTCSVASATCTTKTIRTVACTGTTTTCNLTTGWVIDLRDSGERVNVDPKLQLGTLVIASNVPQTSACTIGGYSWINFINYTTGTEVANSTAGAVSQKLSDSLAVGLNIVRLPDGKTVVITTTSDAKQTTVAAPFDTPSPTGKRISWREISQ